MTVTDARSTPASSRLPGNRGRRSLPLVAGVLLVVALVVVLGPSAGGPPLDPSSAGPDGLLGLVRVLEEVDVEVTVALDPPSDTDTVVFVPLDLLGEERRGRFLDWMRSGGTLVVAGPSRFHEREELGTPVEESFAPATRDVACDLPELAMVDEVRHDGWSDLGDDDGDVRCFSSRDGGGWLLASEPGEGALYILGSADAFTNTWLDEADNAVLATALFGRRPGDALQIVPRPPADERDVGLLDLVAPGVWRALTLLAVAGIVAVIARSRRLGPPVEERLPPVLPSSELARSLAGLTSRAGDRQGAAARLRARARERATHRLGLPTSTPGEVVADRLAAVATVPPDDAARALIDGDVSSDEALVDVARSVSVLLDHLDHPTRDGADHPSSGDRPLPPSPGDRASPPSPDDRAST